MFAWEEGSQPSGSPVDYAAMRELQRAFAHLSRSKKASYNPLSFVDALSLSHIVQQDGQEFCKLFTSILERQLGAGATVGTPAADSRSTMHQYRGKYCYETQCLTCNTPSRRDSVFNELELQTKGHKTLDACLAAYFAEEELKGPNQYQCGPCNGKQDASRGVKLLELPAVLSLHLLRFYYDLKTMNKKKLNAFLQYPETLNMGAYAPAGSDEEDTLYELQAILMHRGPNASSGHYVARVKDLASGKWVELDDDQATQVNVSAGAGLGDANELGEIRSSKGKSKKSPTVPEGSHRCKNVYMLVYRSRKTIAEARATAEQTQNIPEHLATAIDAANVAFEVERKEKIEENKLIVDREQALSKRVVEHYQKLVCTEEVPIDRTEWVPTRWLEQWLADAGKDSQVAPFPLLKCSEIECMHGKLDPLKLCAAKRVNSEGIDALISAFNSDAVRDAKTPRLRGDASCRECVDYQFAKAERQLRLEIAQGKVDAILRPLRTAASVEEGMWVAKEALRQWKLKAFTCSNEVPFNMEARCEHNNLITEEQYLRLVPYDAWRIIAEFAGSSAIVELPSETSSPCAICTAAKEAASAENTTRKIQAGKEKEALPHLYRKSSKRPGPDTFTDADADADADEECTTLHIVPSAFVLEWQAWCRSTGDHDRPTFNFQPLLCKHNLFLFDVNVDRPEPLNPASFQYLTEEEWLTLSKLYPVECETNDDSGDTSEETTCRTVQNIRAERTPTGLVTNLECCAECRNERARSRESAQLDYTSGVLWIRKVEVSADGKLPQLLAEKSAGGGGASRRSSSRSRVGKGCTKFTVDSTLTVELLRVQVMHVFSVMPRDQHIFFGDVELVDNSATLRSFNIPEKAELLLTVDPDVGYGDEAQFEAGFVGTSLLAGIGGAGKAGTGKDNCILVDSPERNAESAARTKTSADEPILIDDDDDDDDDNNAGITEITNVGVALELKRSSSRKRPAGTLPGELQQLGPPSSRRARKHDQNEQDASIISAELLPSARHDHSKARACKKPRNETSVTSSDASDLELAIALSLSET